jgi:hypothetical protein
VTTVQGLEGFTRDDFVGTDVRRGVFVTTYEY